MSPVQPYLSEADQSVKWIRLDLCHIHRKQSAAQRHALRSDPMETSEVLISCELPKGKAVIWNSLQLGPVQAGTKEGSDFFHFNLLLVLPKIQKRIEILLYVPLQD